jgi:amidohydrolase
VDPIRYIEKNKELLINTYSDLHLLAEPSWMEEKTSRYLVEKLSLAGLNVRTLPSHYGIIAEIPGKSSQVIALRADLDAVVQEVDGKVIANHSCGHDAHSTMVLFSALALKSTGIEPMHTLRFIFQPAEEKGGGALQMMKDGALENVAYLFGVHVRPEFEVPYQKAAPVILHGSVGIIKGTIKGLQAHAARPKDGINAIEIASIFIEKLKRIDLNTKISYSIKMTQLKTYNEAENVIPETADFTIDVRAQSNEVMETLLEHTNEIIENIMKDTGSKIFWKIEDLVPASRKNNEAITISERAISEILGEENVVPTCITQGGEDFHFYTAQNPGLHATMLGLGCGLAPGLHHPKMKFNTDALIYGAKILTKTIMVAMEKEN